MTGTSRIHWLRSGICFALVILLAFCPLLQLRAHAASFEDIVMIIWSAMKGCGIQLYGAVSDTLSFLSNEVSEFISSANQSISNVISGFRYSVNNLGEFIINNTFLDFINDFISWFQNKYNLGDNDNVQLTEGTVRLDGLVSYGLPLQIVRDVFTINWSVYIATSSVYAIFDKVSLNSHTFNVSFWSNDEATVKKVSITNSNGNTLESELELVETADNGIYWVRDGQGFDDRYYDISNYTVYLWDTVHEAYTSLPEIEMPEPPVYAFTTTIIAPEYNADFVFGDGAVINIGSDWGDTIYDLFDHIRRLIGDLSNQITIYYRSMQQIQEQVPPASDVTNLPSGSIYQINGLLQDSNGEGGLRLGGIWHYVTSWVEDFSEAAPIVWYCVTSCPDPIVNMVYAVTVITIVIGFIHKARSH